MLPKKFLSLAVIVAFTACSGSGTSGPGASSSQPHQTGSSAKASLKIIVPARHTLASMKKRKPLYVSPSSESILAQSYPHGSSTSNGSTVVDISPGSPNCTSSGSSGARTCMVYVPAPVGDDDFVLTDYDEVPPPGGDYPVTAHVLAVGSLTNVTIVANTSNSLTIYLQGRPSTFVFLPSPMSEPASGTPSSYALQLLVLDTDGNVITAGTNDPYEFPVTLTVAEPSGDTGHTTLSKNGGPGGASQTTSESSDSFSVNYDGGGSAGNGIPGQPSYVPAYFATISADDLPGGVPQPTPNPYAPTAGVGYFSPLYLTGSGAGFTPGYPAAIAFSGSGVTVTITLQQTYQPAGGTLGYGVSSNTCGSSVSVPAPNPDTPQVFTVTSQTGSGTPCTVTFTDGVSNYPVDITWS